MSDIHRDPNHPDNSPEHHTGRPCIEDGCTEPAGTAWGPHWCMLHNAERMERISRSMREMLESFTTGGRDE